MKRLKYTIDELPRPGSVFITPLSDGRFGVVRVLRRKIGSGYAFAFVVPSSWIGSSPVRPSDRDIRKSLVLTHHSWNEKRAANWVTTPAPESFIPAGEIPLTAEDEQIQVESYATWDGFPLQILLQWRWDHDRESVLIEDKARAEKDAEEKRLSAERRAEMLRTLTLEGIARRKWFDSWDEELDALSISPSRTFLSDLIQKLSEEPKLTKVVVRRLLKATVKLFNQLDGKTHFIETTHREDICEALELIMFAAKQPDLVDEIDQWREW